MGELPFAPPAILSPTAVHVALEQEVGTVSAASLVIGIIALLAARVSLLFLKFMSYLSSSLI